MNSGKTFPDLCKLWALWNAELCKFQFPIYHWNVHLATLTALDIRYFIAMRCLVHTNIHVLAPFCHFCPNLHTSLVLTLYSSALSKYDIPSGMYAFVMLFVNIVYKSNVTFFVPWTLFFRLVLA